MKLSNYFLFMSLGLAAFSPQADAASSLSIVENVVLQAKAADNFADFAKLALTNPATREEMTKYLNDNGLASARVPEVFAYGDNFVFDLGGDVPVAFKFVAVPRPHYIYATKVIYLDRPLAEIAAEVTRAVMANDQKTSAVDLLFPKAHALLGFFSRFTNAAPLFGKAAADQAAAAPVADEFEDLKKNAAAKFQFKCEDPKDFPKLKAAITVTDPNADPVRYYTIENFKDDSNKFILKSSINENMMNRCEYKFDNGVANSNDFCGKARVLNANRELKAAYNTKVKEAKKFHSKEKVPPPSELRKADVVVPPGVNLKLVMGCCADDKCSAAHRDMSASGAAVGSGAAGAGARGVSK